MTTELAILHIRNGEDKAFEEAFCKAQQFISCSRGYISHELQKCVEEENKYFLLVHWQTLEDHTKGFRKSNEYNKWKWLLHHFYEPFPVVEHYQKVF